MFYEQFMRLCEERGIKPTSLVRKLGISPSMPKRWESGAEAKIGAVEKIAEYFGVTTDYLLRGDSRSMTNSIGGSVSGSAVVLGGSGNKAAVTRGEPADQLDPSEIELLRIFRNLDMRGKTAVLSCAYDQEERQKNK